MNFMPLFRALLICLCLLTFSPDCRAAEENVPTPIYIAHAGGAVNQQTYTNSLEALEANYVRGYRFFEIDFSWKADGELVAIHDWQGAFRGQFSVPEQMNVPTEAEFLQLEMNAGLSQLNLEGVLTWAKEKGDAFIVTDVKHDNTKALRKIREDFKEMQTRVIPQVYSYQEYHAVYAMGYKEIILTLYRMKINPYEVIEFSRRHAPFAITMPWQVAQSGLANALHQNNTPVYAHTVNDIELFDSLRKMGVKGIYTDTLFQ